MSALAPSFVFDPTGLAAPRARRGGSVGLLGVAVTLFTVSALLLPFALHLLVGAGALVIAMIVAHDAIHSAAHSNVKVNRAIGWAASFACGVPFVMLASNHLRHHRLVDTAQDPERFCLGPAWQLPARGVAMLGFYYVEAWPRLDRRARLSVIIFVLASMSVLMLVPALLVTWSLPLMVAAVLFATFTVWLPHGPYGELVMRVAPFLTGYHDDHHARPAVPSLQYGELHRWHVARGVLTRKPRQAPAPIEVGEALAARLLPLAGGPALRLDAELQAVTVALRSTPGLESFQSAALRLERRGWFRVKTVAGGLELLLAESLRQLSLHPRVRARVEGELARHSKDTLTAVVVETARLQRGEGPAAFDPTRLASPTLTTTAVLAVGVLAGLLPRVRLDVRTGSPIKRRTGLEVWVARR